jgi:alkanesulfonate monooxygenase SsuD/methylene tetrahydromethanopterin reductase-like flavin-dependent oxidoreductase (luciferase family)
LAMAAEIWLHGFPLPRRTVDLAVQAERWGFDGLLLADSENLVGDPYVELALASRDADSHALAESNARFASEVLPALRG